MEMRQVVKIILASELLAAGLNKTQIAAQLVVSRRTMIRWLQAIADHGSLGAFLEHYQQAKTEPRKRRKTDALFKRLIWALCK
jgi:transposase